MQKSELLTARGFYYSMYTPLTLGAFLLLMSLRPALKPDPLVSAFQTMDSKHASPRLAFYLFLERVLCCRLKLTG